MRICARSGGTTKAPFLDHLDRRININKARLTINPHYMTKPSLVDRGRKRKQVLSAPKKSREAKLIKLADKTEPWQTVRHQTGRSSDGANILIGQQVVASLRGTSPWLEQQFD